MKNKLKPLKIVFHNDILIPSTLVALCCLFHLTPIYSHKEPTEQIPPHQEINCFAENLFFEARNANYEEMLNISNVVLNRMHSYRYPNSACSVIFQSKQFSWTLDQRNNITRINKLIAIDKKENEAWMNAKYIASLALTGQIKDYTGNSISYHHVSMNKPKSKFWKHMKLYMVSQFHKYYVASNGS